MKYTIIRNGITIGEKTIEITKEKDCICVDISIFIGKERRQIKAKYDHCGTIVFFSLQKDDKLFEYDSEGNRTVLMKERFQIDEILLTLYCKLPDKRNEYYVFSTENNDFYRIKFYKKTEEKYNILVPTYCYLEYGEDGCLEYLEDFKESLQIIREE